MTSTTQSLIIILIAGLCTLLTRAVPFLIWGGKRPMPPLIKNIADKLPAAIMAILVIYCLKDLSPAHPSAFFASFAALAVVVILHLWKRNMLLSIAVGTIVYMVLIRWM
ncbi:MAG: AzlD domain-containing protein [Clostridiales bacterium]|nr:AzlD domain-containing protein [Clostridiales bacterium]MDY3746969.1 AzlD domain-containing protein [Lachnospiraceae bacterium]